MSELLSEVDDKYCAYHVTRERDLPMIRRQGLVPQIGPRAAMCGESEPRVYLFRTARDADNALLNWLGEVFCDQEEAEGEEIPLVILKVDITGLINLNHDDFFEVAIALLVGPERILETFSEAAWRV